jgi:hypothetical protein
MESEKKLKNPVIGDILIIGLVYFLAYGLSLLNDGIFADDWAFYQVDKASVISITSQAGLPWLANHEILFLSFNNMIPCRILVYLCYFFATLFLYGTLKIIKDISSEERIFIVLFFAIFPVNLARLPLTISHYAVSYLLFFAGLFLLSKYLENKYLYSRILALLCLSLSFFSLQSLLIFYGVVILLIGYAEKDTIKNVKGAFSLLVRYLDFLVAPVIFWAIKITFFMPYGIYAGNNEFVSSNLLTAFLKIGGAFSSAFIAPQQEAFKLPRTNWFFIIIFSVFVSIFAYKKYFEEEAEIWIKDIVLLFFGFLAFILGVYGYLVVDKLPVLFDWYSRFQMLVPLGASFILIYSIRMLINNKAKYFVYSLLLILFINANLVNCLQYQKDWFKELSLIENFRDSQIVRNNLTFLFNDKATKLNARDRIYRFNEYSSLMKRAFGDERRFGSVNIADFNDNIKKLFVYAQYNCRECVMQKPQYEVIIDYGAYKMGASNTLKLMWLKFTNPEQFKSRLRGVIKLDYVKL